MRFPSGTTAQEIATLIDAEVIGDPDAIVPGINEIHKVQQDDMVFVDHPKYYAKCLNSMARFIIINSKDVAVPHGKILLYTSQPFEAYVRIVNHYRPFRPATTSPGADSHIHPSAVIFPGAFIGNNVTIGSNSIIHPNVTIYDHCVIGNDVTIHAGTTIGADAFYFNIKKDREVWAKKMLSCGRVIIEDAVEIGANCCIDKGVTGDTIIGRGTKMDNLIQVGHDVVIGRNCIIASQVGIAGATTIGNGVTIWGQAGINKTLTIHDDVVVLGKSGVANDIEKGRVVWGTPAEDATDKKRELIWIKRIPLLWKKMKEGE